MFATVWLFGKVVLTLGFVGMTEPACEDLKKQMIVDIQENTIMMTVDGTPIRNSDWTVTCEPNQLEVGYARE